MNNTEFELKQNSIFISNTLKKAIWPCMLSILSANINVIVDGILVGQKLGSNALAAINLCLPVYLFMCVIGSFVASGTAINASKAIGSGADKKGNEYYKLSVILTFLISVLFTIIGFIFLNPIVSFLCSEQSILPYVKDYTFITISGALPKIMLYIPFWYLRLDGRNKEVSNMMSILTFGNIILDVLFVYVIDWGVFGAGFASVIATSFAFAYGAVSLGDEASTFKFSLKIERSLISFKKIINAGIPSAFNNLCATIRILIINSVLLSVGGGILVAVFTALNGLYSVGECIILGVPQAATAMIGVYCGERDNKSCEIILKYQIYIASILSGIFLFVSLIMSPVLGKVYGINQNMFMPVLFMGLSILPAFICNMMISYYNIYSRMTFSVFIIFSRLVLMTYIGLLISVKLNVSVFFFLLFAEISTLILIYIITGIIYINNKDLHRFMLCNLKYEKEGIVNNFSIKSDPEEICNACVLISEFCENLNFSVKQIMRIQLGMEEAMVLISNINSKADEAINGFDLRIFNIDNIQGIRIRYDGVDFNPFKNPDESDEYMGIRMVSDLFETVTYQRTFGVNTLILLLKERRSE